MERALENLRNRIIEIYLPVQFCALNNQDNLIIEQIQARRERVLRPFTLITIKTQAAICINIYFKKLEENFTINFRIIVL